MEGWEPCSYTAEVYYPCGGRWGSSAKPHKLVCCPLLKGDRCPLAHSPTQESRQATAALKSTPLRQWEHRYLLACCLECEPVLGPGGGVSDHKGHSLWGCLGWEPCWR